MEILQTWLEGSDLPVLTAFILGLLTAVSPCPLANNITAIGFISKDIPIGICCRWLCLASYLCFGYGIASGDSGLDHCL